MERAGPKSTRTTGDVDILSRHPFSQRESWRLPFKTASQRFRIRAFRESCELVMRFVVLVSLQNALTSQPLFLVMRTGNPNKLRLNWGHPSFHWTGLSTPGSTVLVEVITLCFRGLCLGWSRQRLLHDLLSVIAEVLQ